MLHWVTVLVVVNTVLVGIGSAVSLGFRPRVVACTIAIHLLAAVTQILLRRGRVQLAAHLFLFVLWAIIIAWLQLVSGVRSPMMCTLFAIITISAMLSRRAGLAYAVLSALAVVALYAADDARTQIVDPFPTALLVVVICAAFLTTGGVVSLAARLRDDATAQYVELVQLAPEALVIVDDGGRVRSANPAAVALLGQGEAALRGQSVRALLGLPEAVTLPSSAEHAVVAPDGRSMVLDIEVAALHDGQRIALRDVSARHDAERDRARLIAQLHQAQKVESIGMLAGGVAHDFNNMITATLASVDLLKQRPPADEASELVHDIEAATLRAADLTRQLLAFGRRQVLQPQVLRVDDVVSGVRNMLRRLLAENIELRLVLEASGAVRADAGQLEQVIVNLVVNARDAMPGGGVLTLRTADVTRPGADGAATAHVSLVVEDTGEGIAADVVDRIFEPFFTTKPVGAGTGLGLAVVSGIVAQSGGHISVDTTPGRGARFEVLLPATDAAALTAAARATPDRGVPRGGTVLLIEDEVALRRALARFLRDAGFTVVAASDGDEAVRVAADLAAIDVVVTDVVMPRMGGPDAVRQLRAQRPGLRALFVSGYTERSLDELGATARDTGFLAKPFRPADLVGAVQRLLH